VDKKGKEVRLLKSIAYHHCKGCLRCVNICKFDALESCKEYEVDPKIIEKGFSE
jgi:pyruvate ferredoxin oxidoreductase gamma subunit